MTYGVIQELLKRVIFHTWIVGRLLNVYQMMIDFH